MCEVISEVSHPNTSGACIHVCMGGHTLAILNLLRKAVERLVLELTDVLPFLDLHTLTSVMGTWVLRY